MRPDPTVFILAILLLFSLPLVAQQAESPIRNAKVPVEGVLFGGQVTPEQVTALEKKGYKTILDLRGEGEDRGFDEAAAVDAAGLTYSAVPVDSKTILQPETFENFFQEFDSLERPIVVHCGFRQPRRCALLRLAGSKRRTEPRGSSGYGQGQRAALGRAGGGGRPLPGRSRELTRRNDGPNQTR